MATLVFSMNQSLDGYVDHTGFAPGPQLFRHFIAEAAAQTASIYGRRVYELMRYWEEDQPEWSADEQAFADAWRRQHKWVVSRGTPPLLVSDRACTPGRWKYHPGLPCPAYWCGGHRGQKVLPVAGGTQGGRRARTRPESPGSPRRTRPRLSWWPSRLDCSSLACPILSRCTPCARLSRDDPSAPCY
jgi:hypothetical protein